MPDFAMLLFILKASGSVLAAEGKETESLDVNAQFIEGQVPWQSQLPHILHISSMSLF